jgi:dienelactone hydrolase
MTHRIAQKTKGQGLAAVVAALALLLGTSGACAQQKISIPSETPAGLAPLLHHQAPMTTVSGDLFMPENVSGPVPALVLKHGSGGIQGNNGADYRKWAATFASWGVAALLVDSFGPRGVSNSVADQFKVSSWADVADALASLKVLAADPRIDKSRIGIVGWSRGGGVAWRTAFEAVRKSVITDNLKFAAHIVFYGGAEFQYRGSTDQSPMLFFHGESDDYVAIGPARELADWAKSKGNDVTFVAYPKTFHDFDVQGTHGVVKDAEVFTKCDEVVELPGGKVLRLDHVDNPKTTPAQIAAYPTTCMTHGATIEYNAAARADAVEKVHEFLKKNFRL